MDRRDFIKGLAVVPIAIAAKPEIDLTDGISVTYEALYDAPVKRGVIVTNGRPKPQWPSYDKWYKGR